MLKQEINWFFVIYDSEFRTGTAETSETFVFLALTHFFGFYNPKELADFLNIGSQRLYNQLKKFSIYSLKRCS